MEQDIQHHANTFMNQIRLVPSENIGDLIQNITNKTAIAVTDASVSPYTSVGASSFVITSADLQTSYNGCHGVPQGSAPLFYLARKVNDVRSTSKHTTTYYSLHT